MPSGCAGASATGEGLEMEQLLFGDFGGAEGKICVG